MDATQRKSALKQIGKYNYHLDRKHEFHRAFALVVGRYIGSRFLPPLTSSNPDPLARRVRAHPNSIIWCADVERCVGKALTGRPELMKEFFLFFVFQRALGTQPLQLTLSATKMHGEIIQKCGREFMRIGMFPLWRYFKPKSERRFRELEQMYAEDIAA